MKNPVRNALLLLGLSAGMEAHAGAETMTQTDDAPRVTAEEVERRRAALMARSAGSDANKLRMDVKELAELAKAHVSDVGPSQAIDNFTDKEWTRLANGLHLWGVTLKGVSWFDQGHPELVGTDASIMTDIEGRFWADLARKSASGTGASMFTLVFPHPGTRRSATGYHTCFMMPDQTRVLCAGAFED